MKGLPEDWRVRAERFVLVGTARSTRAYSSSLSYTVSMFMAQHSPLPHNAFMGGSRTQPARGIIGVVD